MNLLAVLLGGALGAWLRYALALRLGTAQYFFSPVLWANVAGCFVFGIFAVVCREHPNELLKLFVLTGICGALTTFSSYLFEAIQSGSAWSAGAVLVLQLLCGLLAMGLGTALGRWVV